MMFVLRKTYADVVDQLASTRQRLAFAQRLNERQAQKIAALEAAAARRAQPRDPKTGRMLPKAAR
jgi:hypothetical protein